MGNVPAIRNWREVSQRMDIWICTRGEMCFNRVDSCTAHFCMLNVYFTVNSLVGSFGTTWCATCGRKTRTNLYGIDGLHFWSKSGVICSTCSVWVGWTTTVWRRKYLSPKCGECFQDLDVHPRTHSYHETPPPPFEPQLLASLSASPCLAGLYPASHPIPLPHRLHPPCLASSSSPTPAFPASPLPHPGRRIIWYTYLRTSSRCQRGVVKLPPVTHRVPTSATVNSHEHIAMGLKDTPCQ